MLKESTGDRFDVIVIGAGVGGLTSAALLAKAGKKVLLVEKETRTGGHINPLVYGAYQFDVGARLMMGCNQDGPFGPGAVYALLDQLGVADRCEFIPIQPFISIRLPGLSFPMWSGQGAFIEGLRQEFPTGLENLKPVLDLCNRIYQAGKALTLAKKPWGLIHMTSMLPDFLRYRNATVEDVLVRTIPDLRPRIALEALWPDLGLAPHQVSFAMWAALMATYIEEGAYYCKGGLHCLSDAISEAFVHQGGELLLGCEATKILVENRAVTGVELAGSRKVFAPVILSNIDPRSVFGGLIDAAQVPASYQRKLKSFKPSIAGISVSLVTDLDLPALGFGYEHLIYNSWDSDTILRQPANGQIGIFSLTITTNVDHSLAPPGYHLVSAMCCMPEEEIMSSQDQSRFSAILFTEIKKHLPQLDDHLILPKNDDHPQGYLSKRFQPIYGWALTPQQSALGRLGQKPPIKGLYLAGQWTQPGPGIVPVILSGMTAVRAILN
jgi:prolycopene isomerase